MNSPATGRRDKGPDRGGASLGRAGSTGDRFHSGAVGIRWQSLPLRTPVMFLFVQQSKT
jgi:hypothetical protein